MRDICKEENGYGLHLEQPYSSQKILIKHAITELDRKVIRHKSACLSSFCRPIDRENLINAQSELSSLRLRMSET